MGKWAMLNGAALADNVALANRRFSPIAIGSGSPVPGLVRPSSFPELMASWGCTPARSCARVTFRAIPFWLTKSSSESEAAVPGAS
jgi:hypothetical protein